MQFTLHATRRTPHGVSRLVQAMSAWLVKTWRNPSRHSMNARVYGHTTTAMHKLSTPRPPRPLSPYFSTPLLSARAPPSKTPPSPHRLYDLQKYMTKWCIPSTADRFCLPQNGFNGFRTHIDPTTPAAFSISRPRPPLKTPPSSHRLYGLQDTHDKLMHSIPQQSDLVLLKNGFYSFRAQTDWLTSPCWPWYKLRCSSKASRRPIYS